MADHWLSVWRERRRLELHDDFWRTLVMCSVYYHQEPHEWETYLAQHNIADRIDPSDPSVIAPFNREDHLSQYISCVMLFEEARLPSVRLLLREVITQKEWSHDAFQEQFDFNCNNKISLHNAVNGFCRLLSIGPQRKQARDVKACVQAVCPGLTDGQGIPYFQFIDEYINGPILECGMKIVGDDWHLNEEVFLAGQLEEVRSIEGSGLVARMSVPPSSLELARQLLDVSLVPRVVDCEAQRRFPTVDTSNPHKLALVYCDLCRKRVQGVMWKCANCSSFEVCGTCEAAANECIRQPAYVVPDEPGVKGSATLSRLNSKHDRLPADHLSSHFFIKIRTPIGRFIPDISLPVLPQEPLSAFEIARHVGYACNRCRVSPIMGTMYMCANCEDVCWCAECEATAADDHDSTHVFAQLRVPLTDLRRGTLLPNLYRTPDMLLSAHRVLQGEHVVRVSCGWCTNRQEGHVAVLVSSGVIFTGGANNYGQLGRGLEASSDVAPVRLPLAAVQVACGENHTVALLANGGMYAWGSNMNGQLGLDLDELPKSTLPFCVPDTGARLTGARPIAVACGEKHTAALFDNGLVAVCGGNKHGQLGLPAASKDNFQFVLVRDFYTIVDAAMAEEDESNHELLDVPPWIVQVACGARHTLMLSNTGDLFACGDNEFGQLGLTARDMDIMGAVFPSRWGPTGVVTACTQVGLANLKNHNIERSILKIDCGEQHSSLLVRDAINDARCTLLSYGCQVKRLKAKSERVGKTDQAQRLAPLGSATETDMSVDKAATFMEFRHQMKKEENAPEMGTPVPLFSSDLLVDFSCCGDRTMAVSDCGASGAVGRMVQGAWWPGDVDLNIVRFAATGTYKPPIDDDESINASRIRALFDWLDSDNNGHLTEDEFTVLLLKHMVYPVLMPWYSASRRRVDFVVSKCLKAFWDATASKRYTSESTGHCMNVQGFLNCCKDELYDYNTVMAKYSQEIETDTEKKRIQSLSTNVTQVAFTVQYNALLAAFQRMLMGLYSGHQHIRAVALELWHHSHVQFTSTQSEELLIEAVKADLSGLSAIQLALYKLLSAGGAKLVSSRLFQLLGSLAGEPASFIFWRPYCRTAVPTTAEPVDWRTIAQWLDYHRVQDIDERGQVQRLLETVSPNADQAVLLLWRRRESSTFSKAQERMEDMSFELENLTLLREFKENDEFERMVCMCCRIVLYYLAKLATVFDEIEIQIRLKQQPALAVSDSLSLRHSHMFMRHIKFYWGMPALLDVEELERVLGRKRLRNGDVGLKMHIIERLRVAFEEDIVMDELDETHCLANEMVCGSELQRCFRKLRWTVDTSAAADWMPQRIFVWNLLTFSCLLSRPDPDVVEFLLDQVTDAAENHPGTVNIEVSNVLPPSDALESEMSLMLHQHVLMYLAVLQQTLARMRLVKLQKLQAQAKEAATLPVSAADQKAGRLTQQAPTPSALRFAWSILYFGLRKLWLLVFVIVAAIVALVAPYCLSILVVMKAVKLVLEACRIYLIPPSAKVVKSKLLPHAMHTWGSLSQKVGSYDWMHFAGSFSIRVGMLNFIADLRKQVVDGVSFWRNKAADPPPAVFVGSMRGVDLDRQQRLLKVSNAIAGRFSIVAAHRNNYAWASALVPAFGYLLWLLLLTLFIWETAAGGMPHVLRDSKLAYDNAIMEALVNDDWNDNHLTFTDIAVEGEFWGWMKEILVPAMFHPVILNGTQLEHGKIHFNGIRVRQKRVAASSCIHPRPPYDCRGPYSHFHEETEPFFPRFHGDDVDNHTGPACQSGAGAGPPAADCAGSGDRKPRAARAGADLLEHVHGAWTYRSSAENGFAWYTNGRLDASYFGGGFVHDIKLGEGEEAVLAEVEELQASAWIDSATRVVFVELNAFSYGVDMLSTITLAVEFPAQGAAMPSYHIVVFRPVRLTFLFVVFICVSLYFVSSEALQMIVSRNYFWHFWNYYEMVLSLFYLTIIAMRVVNLGVELDMQEVLNSPDYYNLQLYSTLVAVETNVLAFVVIFSWLRGIKFLMKFPRAGPLVNAMINIFIEPNVVTFCGTYLFVMLCFALGFYFLLGGHLFAFSTMPTALMSMFRISMLGDIDYAELAAANHYSGPILYTLIVVFTSLVLTNILIAIVSNQWDSGLEDGVNHYWDLVTDVMSHSLGEHLFQLVRDCRNSDGTANVLRTRNFRVLPSSPRIHEASG